LGMSFCIAWGCALKFVSLRRDVLRLGFNILEGDSFSTRGS